MNQEIKFKKTEKVLENMISYFSSHRQLAVDTYTESENNNKYTTTIGINFVAVIAVLAASLVNIFGLFRETLWLILVFMIIPLIAFIYFIIMFLYLKMNNLKNYRYKIIRLDVIIDWLWHLKVLEKNVDLTPLINRLDLDLRDQRVSIKDYESTRLLEIIRITDKISSEMIANGQ